mgnify:CR=1 FL=1
MQKAVGFSGGAAAQSYPTKPIRLIIATAPGGLMDIPGRLYSEFADRSNWQRVLVENRGGAGGNLGVEAVAKAAPDGYTLLIVAAGQAAIPALYPKLPYDTARDFASAAEHDQGRDRAYAQPRRRGRMRRESVPKTLTPFEGVLR